MNGWGVVVGVRGGKRKSKRGWVRDGYVILWV